jgi:hypothetical protein
MATAEDRKKLSYFVQDEFFAVENVYNDAANHFHAISNFVKPNNSTCNNTDSLFRDEIALVTHTAYCASEFSGKFFDWENFRYTFESLVDSSDAMSNTLKFHYLKSSITGDTAMLNNLQISDDN